MLCWSDIINGALEIQRCGFYAKPHAHVDGDEVRLAVRSEECAGIDKEQMKRAGWSYDADTDDWFIVLPNGC